MKSSKLYECLALSAIVLALCAFPGNAATKTITLGNDVGATFTLDILSVTSGVPGDPNNPNQFQVYFAQAKGLAWGFLLDGSDVSNVMMKRFEDTRVTGRNITFFYDDDPAVNFQVMNSMRGPNTPAVVYKILYLSSGNQ